MATVAASAVTVLKAIRFGSQPVTKLVQAQVVLDTQGAAANHIPASAFGLGSLLMASNVVEDDGSTLYETGILVGTRRGNASSAYEDDVLVIGADDGDALENVSGTFLISVVGAPLS